MRMTVVKMSEVAKANRLDPGYWIALAELREKATAQGCTPEALQASLSREEAAALLLSLPATSALKEVLAASPNGTRHGRPLAMADLAREHPYETLSCVMVSLDKVKAAMAAERSVLDQGEAALSAVANASQPALPWPRRRPAV